MYSRDPLANFQAETQAQKVSIESPPRGIDPETLRVRRALAQKLKYEVIGKS